MPVVRPMRFDVVRKTRRRRLAREAAQRRKKRAQQTQAHRLHRLWCSNWDLVAWPVNDNEPRHG